MEQELTPWISGIAALLGVLIGGLTQWFIEWRKQSHEARALRNALFSEVNGLLEIIEIRQFKKTLIHSKNIVSQTGQPLPYQIKIPDNYAAVYSANVARLGLLKPSEASFLARFHQLILSLVQDVTPDGVLYKGGSESDFSEAIQLLGMAVDIGSELVEYARLPQSLKS